MKQAPHTNEFQIPHKSEKMVNKLSFRNDKFNKYVKYADEIVYQMN